MVTVHLENDGVGVSMLLDIVEVARLHSGFNLAAAFVKILDDFGISDKVSKRTGIQFLFFLLTGEIRSCLSPATMCQITTR